MASEPASPSLPADRYEHTLAMHGAEPSFNDDGVDLTQIRAALDRTPTERLLHHEASANSLRWMLAVSSRVQSSDVEAI